MDNKNLYYFNSDLDLQFILSNDKPGACPYENAAHIEGLDLTHELEFTAPADNEEAKELAEGGYVGLFDKDNDFQLFEIYLIEEEDNIEGVKRVIFADHVFQETDKLPVTDKRPYDATAEEALTAALSGQVKWKVGNVASLGINSTNFYYESVKSSIVKIIEKWGGEPKTRITFEENRITGFYIDILARRGADTGKRITVEKDAASIKRKVDFTNLYTAIYPRGKGEQTENGGYTRRITIKDVVWSKANGKPTDKPAGQEWIGNEEARERFGIPDGNGGKLHRDLFLNFDETEDTNQLINEGWNTLQGHVEPLVSYEATVSDLESIYSHEAVRLGDTNFIIDNNFKPSLLSEVRVIKLKRFLDDEYNTEITLGNFLPLFTDTSKTINDLRERLGGRQGVWDQVENPVQDKDIEDIVPPVPENVKATGLFKSIVVDWDFKSDLYIAAYEVYGSKVPGFAVDQTNLLWRGKSGGYAHKGGNNEQWYFRVRAVNTHGTASALTDEVTAKTVVVGAQDIAPLTITNELIAENAFIDFAKMANVEIVNAMINDVSADKLTAGLINTDFIKIQGGTDSDYTKIDGSFLESRGHFSRTWRGETKNHDIKLKFENGYLRARNDTENRSLYFTDFGVSTQVDGINASGTLEFFSKVNSELGRGVTLSSEGVTTVEANGGSLYLSSAYQIVGNASLYVPSIVTTTTNAYIGADGELRVVNKGTADTTQSSQVTYRDVRASIYRGIALDLDGTTSAAHMYVRPSATGSLRVTARGTTDSYRPVEASDFNVTSSSFAKKNIEDYNENATDIIKGTPVREYHLTEDIEEIDLKRVGLVVQEAPLEIINMEGGASINLYAMASILWKSIQEIANQIEELKTKITG